MLVEKLAVTYLRMQRCAWAEAQSHREMWKGNNPVFVRAKHERKIAAVGMYDLRLTNQFVRLLREIKGVQHERKNAECRLQSAECRTAAAHSTVEESAAKGESQAGAPVPQEKMKNEPNSAVSRTDPPATHETLDSRLRARDESRATKMRNEPNSAEEDGAAGNLAKVSTNLRKVGFGEAADMKNEPNMQISDCRMPIAECRQEMKNEPNLLQVPMAAGDENGQVAGAGCEAGNAG